MAVLILKHASASRICGEWNDHDYDRARRPRCRRPHHARQCSAGGCTIFGQHEDRTPTHGYAVTREAAMTERVKAGGYENRQCLSDSQRLAKAVGPLRCRGARAAEARLADPVSSSKARRTFASNLRRLFLARDWSPYAVYQRGRKIALPWSSQSAALRVPPLRSRLRL
jgi:hypothetical protein